jgi:hypothetical protein
MSNKTRFAIGANVRVRNPGVNGIVREVDEEPTSLGEYWHTIQTEHGERNEPGCNLQLVPKAQTQENKDVSGVRVGMGKPPNQWTPMHFANIGTSEEFVQQLTLEMCELVNGTMILGPKRDDVIHAIMTISTEGVMPAFEHLKSIRASVMQPMPVLNRKQLYEDFTRVLWHAYKDLMPRATQLIGMDMGFQFQNDSNFEKGLVTFMEAHPSLRREFGEGLRTLRTNWQTNFGNFRNHYLEHRQEEPDKYKDFYLPNFAEALFDTVWRTIVDILAMFLAMRLPPGFCLEEIPIRERCGDPPRRFRLVLGGKAPQ